MGKRAGEAMTLDPCGTCESRQTIVVGFTPRTYSDPGGAVTRVCPTCDGEGFVVPGTECPEAVEIVEELILAEEFGYHTSQAGEFA